MLPLEPPQAPCSAQLRQRRALEPPRSPTSVTLLPFEPLPLPSKPFQLLKESSESASTTIDSNTPTPVDAASDTIAISHELFDAAKYESALAYYKSILETCSYALDASDYIGVVCHAAKCCHYLHLYDQEHDYCQLALDCMNAATASSANDSLLGDAMIQCTLLKAKALGRLRKTTESRQVLRDCRALIIKYTSYKSVTEYMSEHERDGMGFLVSSPLPKAAMIVPGV